MRYEDTDVYWVGSRWKPTPHPGLRNWLGWECHTDGDELPPPADAEIDHEDRAEHCWNGDHTRPNAYSRLRYHQMFMPRIMDQIRRNHPAGADTISLRY